MTFLAGQTGTAAAFNSAITAVTPLTAYKTADETVTSSATLQDDNELFVTVAANMTYIVTGYLYVSSTSATPDFKAAYTGPASATFTNSLWGQTTTASSTIGSIDVGVSTAIGSAHGRGTFNGPVTLTIFGLLTVAGTAGTFRLQWAQNTSDPAGVTLKAGSWLKLTPA